MRPQIVDGQLDAFTGGSSRSRGDVPARFHGGYHRSQLFVLEMRPAGAARAAERWV